MEYVNRETGLRIKLNDLNEAEKKLYERALKDFRQNVNWLEFDHFVLGKHSALYNGKRSHLDVLKHPLYLALKDMWLQLGVRQGVIARTGSKVGREQEAFASRREA